MSEWLDNVKNRAVFLNNFSSKFLHNRLIRNTMFVAADGFFQKLSLIFRIPDGEGRFSRST